VALCLAFCSERPDRLSHVAQGIRHPKPEASIRLRIGVRDQGRELRLYFFQGCLAEHKFAVHRDLGKGEVKLLRISELAVPRLCV